MPHLPFFYFPSYFVCSIHGPSSAITPSLYTQLPVSEPCLPLSFLRPWRYFPDGWSRGLASYSLPILQRSVVIGLGDCFLAGRRRSDHWFPRCRHSGSCFSLFDCYYPNRYWIFLLPFPVTVPHFQQTPPSCQIFSFTLLGSARRVPKAPRLLLISPLKPSRQWRVGYTFSPPYHTDQDL